MAEIKVKESDKYAIHPRYAKQEEIIVVINNKSVNLAGKEVKVERIEAACCGNESTKWEDVIPAATQEHLKAWFEIQKSSKGARTIVIEK